MDVSKRRDSNASAGHSGPSRPTHILRDVLLIASGSVLSILYNRYIYSRLIYYLKGGVKRRKDRCGEALTDVLLSVVNQGLVSSRVSIDALICAQYCQNEELHPMMGSFGKCRFAERVGILAERHCPALRDFTGEGRYPTALDIGCLAGGVSFELARSFKRVYGCDPIKECVHAAQTMASRGWMRCRVVDETELFVEKTVSLPDDSIDTERVSFAQVPFGDLYALKNAKVFRPTDPFDCVVALCLTRMDNPKALLDTMMNLVAPGGICVLGSAFEWSEENTPRSKWLGGYVSKDGIPIPSMSVVTTTMSTYFTLIHQENIPFVIRDTSRRIIITEYTVSVWKRQ